MQDFIIYLIHTMQNIQSQEIDYGENNVINTSYQSIIQESMPFYLFKYSTMIPSIMRSGSLESYSLKALFFFFLLKRSGVFSLLLSQITNFHTPFC